ncbi:DUF6280 family protein [Sulfitobacter sp.]|jgi:hypothetical protein|uniref:DUF6280 family protein n=1 Tax=Sulfitobacter sp. TaxID=1903071 RepID=UPI003EF0E526
MNIDLDRAEHIREQSIRTTKLFAAIVLTALDDAIVSERKYGNGQQEIARWARSRDGQTVLTCAGVNPSDRVVQGLMNFVIRGMRTSVGLSREEGRRMSHITS